MPLTPEEEKRLREEIRKKLEERLRREQKIKSQTEESRRRQLEERLRAKIREEEEERFYTEHGYVKYINRHGEVEWLPEEEAERRRKTRRKRKPSTHHRNKARKRKLLLINISAVVSALLIFFIAFFFIPNRTPKKGNLVVYSDVEGATIYVDGQPLKYFTPDTVMNLRVGKHYVTVYKEGFSTYPPMSAITVFEKKTTAVSFKLKSSARLGKIKLNVNISGYKLFVDGVPAAVSREGITEIPVGYHTVMVIKKGYWGEPSFQRIFVQEGGVTEVYFDLIPSEEIGYLEVATNLHKGHVFIDNQYTGMQASTELIPVPAGNYVVRVRQNGYHVTPDSAFVNVVPGDVESVVFRLEKISRKIPVTITSENPGALVIVDGEWTPFVTPVKGMPLTTGSHFINLVRGEQEYKPTEEFILVRNRKNQQFHFKF